jgi:hypothetical protein
MSGDESILTVYYILAYGQGITNVLFGIAASTKNAAATQFLAI